MSQRLKSVLHESDLALGLAIGVPTRQLARLVGRSPRTIYRWSAKPEFQRHVKRLRTEIFRLIERRVNDALAELGQPSTAA